MSVMRICDYVSVSCAGEGAISSFEAALRKVVNRTEMEHVDLGAKLAKDGLAKFFPPKV